MNVLLDSINHQIVKKFPNYKLNKSELSICFKFYSFLNMSLTNTEVVTSREEFVSCIRKNLAKWDERIREHQKELTDALHKLDRASVEIEE